MTGRVPERAAGGYEPYESGEEPGKTKGPPGTPRRPHVTDDDYCTVKVLPPGPAPLENGPQPASDPATHVAPAGQARAMAV